MFCKEKGSQTWNIPSQNNHSHKTMGCNYSSFCSAPSDEQSSRQHGASTSTPSPDWLSLLAKAHWIGWACGGRSTGWPVELPEELPFSCWDTTLALSAGRPTVLGSSTSFGGLDEGGEEERFYRKESKLGKIRCKNYNTYNSLM